MYYHHTIDSCPFFLQFVGLDNMSILTFFFQGICWMSTTSKSFISRVALWWYWKSWSSFICKTSYIRQQTGSQSYNRHYKLPYHLLRLGRLWRSHIPPSCHLIHEISKMCIKISRIVVLIRNKHCPLVWQRCLCYSWCEWKASQQYS